ncbi:AAA family ATPase [Candidatus Woesearchaeota archaeon]|nr:AAA family ATPase [Candidatus Woesearchaeota archaeon]
MIIRSLKLRNIRSYVDANIEFPEGSVLLSGDIGSGKTTILLAIEFAIFGIMKGVVSGTSLLRHGASKGSVELAFTLGKDNVMIVRSLKRSSSGVVQEPGMLIVNGKGFEGTPQELKAKILELIGYPESLLNKSKSLIFRYTVFTPQEEMKRILYESKEDRMDILRKLFNIDKYKSVKENAFNYVRELKSRINVLEGKLEALPEKKQEAEEYEQQAALLKQELEQLNASLAKAKDDFENAKKAFEALEKELELLNQAEKAFEVKQSELKSFSSQLERSEKELARNNAVIDELLKGLEGFDVSKADDIKGLVGQKKQELKAIDAKLSEINTKKAEFSTKKAASNNIINEMAKLDICPTCRQKVTAEHVQEVTGREKVIIANCEANLSKLSEFDAKLKEKRKRLEAELENYQQGEKELEAKKVKLEMLEEKKERKKSLEQDISELKLKLANTRVLLEEANAKLKGQDAKKQEAEKARQLMEEKRKEKDKAERLAVEKNTRLSTLSQVITRLKKEIEKMQQDREKLGKNNELKSWLESCFISLADTIERHILARIYSEFNSFFQEWFNTLIEDETMSIRLDDSFSPVIEQNGYETWIDNLSGGEKTSVALSYRLALNKVINDFMSTIRTRDLIILDEPTEGFSSEQLDRVREVLTQANVSQVIIVSHEAKMEGFVDRVIRINKHSHESRIGH